MKFSGKVWVFGDDLNTDAMYPGFAMKMDPPEAAKHIFYEVRPGWTGEVSAGDIVMAGKNFGVGSSREAAVYALVDYGIRCVVATSFGDIFAGNAVNNGLVAAIVTEEDVEKLLSAVEQTGRAEVDLEEQTIKSGNYVVPFTIDAARRTRLLNGWDDLDLTAQYKDRIAAFAAKDQAARPWAVPANT